MHKYHFDWNPYSLEKWVNEMAAHNWHLKKFPWVRFTFEPGEPSSYSYRHDELEWGTPHEMTILNFFNLQEFSLWIVVGLTGILRGLSKLATENIERTPAIV